MKPAAKEKMSAKRYFWMLFVAVIVVMGVMFAFFFYKRINKFSIEDQIHSTFYPVVRALYEYEHDHNAPAPSLKQLVPNYIVSIPESRYANFVNYRVFEDGHEWQLSIHSSILSQPRVYCCRSNQKYTSDEERRILFRFHTVWTVLTER